MMNYNYVKNVFFKINEFETESNEIPNISLLLISVFSSEIMIKVRK